MEKYSYSTEELDKFFEESPLFEEDRKREQKELELLNSLKNKDEDDMLDESLKCKICQSRNVDIRRMLDPRDKGCMAVLYCLNCHKVLPF